MGRNGNTYYLVAPNGKNSSILFGGKTLDGKPTTVVPLRHKEAQDLAAQWPTSGHIVIYKLVPVQNYWHDGPAGEKKP